MQKGQYKNCTVHLKTVQRLAECIRNENILHKNEVVVLYNLTDDGMCGSVPDAGAAKSPCIENRRFIKALRDTEV